MKTRLAVLATGAVAALAAAPAAVQATPPQPTPICVHTNRGTICTYDLGGIVNDPVGYACSQPEFTCGPIPPSAGASVKLPLEPVCYLTTEGWVCLP